MEMSEEHRAAISAYFKAMRQLIDLGIARSYQNFTGDIGEAIAADLLNGERLPINSDGDVRDRYGVVEVKTVTSGDGNTSAIRNFEGDHIKTERLLLIVLNRHDGEIVHAKMLTNPVINDCKAYNSRTKSYAVVTKKALRHPDAVNATNATPSQ